MLNRVRHAVAYQRYFAHTIDILKGWIGMAHCSSGWFSDISTIFVVIIPNMW